MHKSQGNLKRSRNGYRQGIAIAKHPTNFSLFRDSSQKKKIRSSLFFALMSLVVLSPSARPAVEDASNPQYGGTLHLGTYRKPAPFNPFAVTETITSPLMDLVFSKLIQRNANGDFEPDLAERWEVSGDGLAYTFYLRHDVRFHDGTPLTSKDVVKTFESYSNRQLSPYFSDYFNMVKEWRTPSDFIFQAVLKEPFSPFLISIWRAWISPSKYLKTYRRTEGWKDVIGSGPFIFEGQDPSGDLRLKANKNYYKGKPYLDEIYVKLYPLKSHVWSAFLRGDIDMVHYLDRKNYEEIKENPSFRVFRILQRGGYLLMFNLKDSLLSNPHIRQVISLAINREEILTHSDGGEGVLLNGPFDPFLSDFSSQGNPSIFFDPILAKSILAQEGFTENDRMMERNGQKLILRLLVEPENESLIQIAKLIRQQLQEVGIGLDLQFFTDDRKLREILSPANPNFQCYLFTYGYGTDPDIASRYWQSNGAFNWSGYKNAEVDALLKAARKDRSAAERMKKYERIQKIISEERLAIFLYIPYVYHVVSKKVGNVHKLFGPFVPFFRLSKVYLKENRSDKGGD